MDKRQIQEFWDGVLRDENLELPPMNEILLPVEKLEVIAARRELSETGETGKPKLYEIMRMSLQDIGNLRKRTRKIFRLRAKNMTYDEIAKVMKMSVKAVDKSLQRTKEGLLKKFHNRVKNCKLEE